MNRKDKTRNHSNIYLIDLIYLIKLIYSSARKVFPKIMQHLSQ